MLGEDDESGELRRDLPDKSSVSSEPLDVALVAAVEEYRAVRAPAIGGSDKVALVELGEGGEAEVVEVLAVVAGLVSEGEREVSGFGSGEGADKFRRFVEVRESGGG